jgi:preprotein translocase subunit SecG
MILLVLITILHIIVSFFLIIVVLLQSGKAADLAGAFGGMGSQTAFGPRGAATLLSKATTASAILFMLTSMSLAILANRGAGIGAGPGTVLDRATPEAPAQQQQQKAPANPMGQPLSGSPGAPQPNTVPAPGPVTPTPATPAPQK